MILTFMTNVTINTIALLFNLSNIMLATLIVTSQTTKNDK